MRVMRNFGIVVRQVHEEVRVLKYIGNLIERKNEINQEMTAKTDSGNRCFYG
jgi:hypothetical protein